MRQETYCIKRASAVSLMQHIINYLRRLGFATGGLQRRPCNGLAVLSGTVSLTGELTSITLSKTACSWVIACMHTTAAHTEIFTLIEFLEQHLSYSSSIFLSVFAKIIGCASLASFHCCGNRLCAHAEAIHAYMYVWGSYVSTPKH